MNFISKILIPALLAATFASCKKEPVIQKPNFILVPGAVVHRPNASLMTADGNICFIGQLAAGPTLQKASPDGSLLWSSPTVMDQLYAVVQTTAGEIYASGYTPRNHTNRKNDMVVYKFTATGDTAWSKVYGTTEDEYGMCLLATSDGNLIVAGIWGGFSGQNGLYMVKINPAGDVIWTRQFPANNYLSPNQLLEMKNGDLLLSADYNTQGAQLASIRRFKADGSLLWQKDDTANTTASASVEMADGSIVTCGSKMESFQGQAWVRRSDAAGNKIWDKNYGSEMETEGAMDIKQSADGSMVIIGNIQSGFMTVPMFFRIDGEGNLLQSMRFTAGTFATGVNVLKDSNDDSILLGQTDDKTYFVRMDNKGKFK